MQQWLYVADAGRLSQQCHKQAFVHAVAGSLSGVYICGCTGWLCCATIYQLVANRLSQATCYKYVTCTAARCRLY
jgi:hypothetical protein